jgi:hypothetical protein
MKFCLTRKAAAAQAPAAAAVSGVVRADGLSSAGTSSATPPSTNGTASNSPFVLGIPSSGLDSMAAATTDAAPCDQRDSGATRFAARNARSTATADIAPPASLIATA